MGSYYYYPLFIEEKIEAQKLHVILLGLPGWYRQNYDWGTKHETFDSRTLAGNHGNHVTDRLPLCSTDFIFIACAVLL